MRNTALLRRPFAVLLLVALLVLAGREYLSPLLRQAEPVPEDSLRPNDWFYRQRAYPSGKIDKAAYIRAVQHKNEQAPTPKAASFTGNWVLAGPTNTGGRITDLEMHAADASTLYACAASGGIFKSADAGVTWAPIFDQALNLSIGDMAIAPSDPNVLYVGTGESNAGGGSLAYDGVGMYKSTDAGATWTHQGPTNVGSIGRVVVHATNPDIAYFAAMGSLFADNADRGIYRTTDGGANWNQVLYVNDSTGGIDMTIHPTDPDTVYAALWERVRRPHRRKYGGPGCGIYRSVDGGNSWTELTNGLPSTDLGRIGIAISASSPNVLYAMYAREGGSLKDLYKSTDHGNSWSLISKAGITSTTYFWWFGKLEVDPNDPDNVYVQGFRAHRSTNGGASWNNTFSGVHVDQHAVVIHPSNSNLVFLGNDGGVYKSVNGGNSWTHQNTLPITQFYACEVDFQFPDRLYGGTQDNGTNRTLTGALNDWTRIYGGDGFTVRVDPSNNNYVYALYQYGNFARSVNGGASFNAALSGVSGSDRFNWNSPYVLDPANPQRLYFGSHRVYRSNNRAASWTAVSPDLSNGSGGGNLTYGTVTTIDVSPVNSDIIYAGTDDGNVSVSTDFAASWTNVSGSLPNRWITKVAADPFRENIAYVTLSGYRFDDELAHVFTTTDTGATWTDISGNLPDIPVNDIVVDPQQPGQYFVATDAGVYATTNGGINWQVMGFQLPNVPVADLTFHDPTRTLVAGTFGRSLYKYDVGPPNPLAIPTDEIALQLEPGPVVRMEGMLAEGQTGKTLHIARSADGSTFGEWDALSFGPADDHRFLRRDRQPLPGRSWYRFSVSSANTPGTQVIATKQVYVDPGSLLEGLGIHLRTDAGAVRLRMSHALSDVKGAELHDLQGRRVAAVALSPQGAGIDVIDFPGFSAAEGIYVVRVFLREGVLSRKVFLARP